MKNLKIIILTTISAILAVATVGVALAYSNGGSPYYEMMGYSATGTDDDWWTEMQEHMEDHWNEVDEVNNGDWWDEMIGSMENHWDEIPQEIQDEEWFNDMRAYMEVQIGEVQSQDWFDDMTQFMEEQSFGGYGYGYVFQGCR